MHKLAPDDPLLTPVGARFLRAERLRKEARNCLAIAVGMDGKEFASALIDEAARLATRARELDRDD
jgi:hypothetical protein